MFSQVVSRPVATWMIAIAIAVFGMVSYGRLPLNLMPDLSYPSVTVRTEVPGYAPEEVESQISRPIEEAVATTQRSGAKRLALFHHDPARHDDQVDAFEQRAQALLPSAFAAREGTRIAL